MSCQEVLLSGIVKMTLMMCFLYEEGEARGQYLAGSEHSSLYCDITPTIPLREAINLLLLLPAAGDQA